MSEQRAELDLVHEDGEREGGFYLHDDQGARLGEMEYRRAEDGVLEFHHTWVHESLQGQGCARQLLDAAMLWVRSTGGRVLPTCRYVSNQFDRDPSLADLRAKSV
jgi:predicted GNAT family acetyltransferase